MNIPEKLQILQNLSGFTQEKLAQALGVSFATLNSWINGKSTPRQGAQKKIEALYFSFTDQRDIPEDPLRAKKQILLEKSRKNPGILKKILQRSDLYDQFILSLTYHSNRIEGSTFTENETAAVLFHQATLSNKDILEHLEVKNHQTALNFLFQFLREGKQLNEKFILKLHAILMNGIRPDAGMYRNHPVRIVGANIPTTNYRKVPESMNHLCKKLPHKTKDWISWVTEFHSQFEQIHPFSDGNGRLGRLLMTAMLLQKNFPPAVIQQQKKRFYLQYLGRAQKKGEFYPLENFICDAILIGFRMLQD